ncbi:MAG TPA: hypothetical protein VFQ36_15235 [Ktedonobacteraceae bacterium]|nr:hypothetical protein [Ktedonobacteraceae bacterium]
MHLTSRSKVSILLAFVALVTLVGGLWVTNMQYGGSPAHAASTPMHIDCSTGNPICTDIADSSRIFGHYTGHDEPAETFYSNLAGSGNRMRWQLTLPRDPSTSNPLTAGKSYNFELHPAFWFSMVMCDTQSDPNQISTCAPDTDKNIVDPTVSLKHPGTAFMEMQFYPPGWVPNGLGASGTSCDPTRWCAALNIDSLSDNPVTGQNNNPACAAAAGLEYVNFAIITKNGVPQAPISPLLANLSTFRADPQKALFMNSGDTIGVTMRDTQHGLRIDLNDQTSGQSGFMVTSAANGFAQVRFDPNGTNCDVATHNLPYDFHPMYSTSSEKTHATWTAHAFSVGFSDEIGHFDFCTGTNAITPQGTCPAGNTEGGAGPNNEPTDADDVGCFPASSSLLIQVAGCTGSNAGFDGQSYQPRWPDGNTKLHPTPIRFTSPLTGSSFSTNYNRYAFETDLAAVEAQFAGSCDVLTGAGCSLLPPTDDCFGPKGTPPCAPAAFYPFYSIQNVNGRCVWQLGNHIPGSLNDFHQNAEYGTLLAIPIVLQGGGVVFAFEDFRQVFSSNPCRA